MGLVFNLQKSHGNGWDVHIGKLKRAKTFDSEASELQSPIAVGTPDDNDSRAPEDGESQDA